METKILYGAGAALQLQQQAKPQLEAVMALGHQPRLDLFRMGEDSGDLAYEKSLKRQAEAWGVKLQSIVLPKTATTAELASLVQKANQSTETDGIMLLRPLPKHIDQEVITSLISTAKDVDGMTPANMAALIQGDPEANKPATAAAVMALLNYYQLGLATKNVTIVGRSLVIGRPLALMMMQADATVTVCHSKTRNLISYTANADLVVSTVGKPNFFTDAKAFKPGGIAIDVGVNDDGCGGVCGDVAADLLIGYSQAINPLFKGLGAVTTAVLLKQVIRSSFIRHSGKTNN
jgi:methylenetetrahydrofolate dehydrogenase (NADP+)/methenyltetrahydrofolate cyclohydrolase